MQKIDMLRAEIDEIHLELAQLYRRRLRIANQIWQIKKSQNLPFIDQQREQVIIHRFDETLLESAERQAVQSFFKAILSGTKFYLEANNK